MQLGSNMGLYKHDRSETKTLLLWLLGGAIMGVLFDQLLNHLPDSVQGIILLAAVVIIFYPVDLPKRTTKICPTLLFWVPVALGLFCVVMWKVTGGYVWVRIGIACICVSAVYRVYPLRGIK